jgi:hypothetical protein
MDNQGNRIVEIVVPLMEKIESKIIANEYQICQVDLGKNMRDSEK